MEDIMLEEMNLLQAARSENQNIYEEIIRKTMDDIQVMKKIYNEILLLRLNVIKAKLDYLQISEKLQKFNGVQYLENPNEIVEEKSTDIQ